MDKIKGILFAALSSSTFGLAPFFTISLIMAGYSTFEALSYRWGVASLFLFLVGVFSGGIRIETDPHIWLYIAGLGLVATAISNISLVQGIKLAGPTLASIMGAMEPLTAVVIGIFVFGETFSWHTAVGIVLILFAVLLVILKQQKK